MTPVIVLAISRKGVGRLSKDDVLRWFIVC